jgi:hypothetical protein
VLLIVFTVGLAHGLLHERGRRESNIGAEIMIRASDQSVLLVLHNSSSTFHMLPN